MKEDAVESDAKALANAFKNADNKNRIEDDEVIRVLGTRSKLHLQEVYEYYKKHYNNNIDEVKLRELEKELSTRVLYFPIL